MLARQPEAEGKVGVVLGVDTHLEAHVAVARHLSRAGIKVLEVERPKRRHLGRNGTDDVVGFLGEATSPEGGKLGHKPWALSASW